MSGITRAGMILNQSKKVFQHLTSFFDMENLFQTIRDETVYKPLKKIGGKAKTREDISN